MRILLSNDDGIYAPGLRALYKALSEAGHEVQAIAPLVEQSGVSGGISTHVPLRVHEIREAGFHGKAVEGTPVDCVKLALTTLVSERPDLVVMGINAGSNLGTDVFYSGTVGGATEAAMLGLPAMAFSRPSPQIEPPEACAAHACSLIGSGVWKELPPGGMLNVNYPPRPVTDIMGIRMCRMSTTPWRETYLQREDPSGRPYWWISGYLKRPAGGEDTDLSLIREGWVAVTPLQLDRTDMSAFSAMESFFQ